MDDGKKVIINGVPYVPARTLESTLDGMEYCVIRSQFAGVFAGYIAERNGDEVKAINVRRLWYWDGADSLSQLAMEGVKKPENCRFLCVVNEVLILGVIEIINCTEDARQSISEVPVWEK